MEEGGGASRSTTPAVGTSAATDVSLREYIDVQLRAQDKLFSEKLEGLKELIESKHDSAQTAVTLALSSQKELAEKHNDLIRAGEKKDATYATKEDTARIDKWQNKITGGLMVVAAVGVINFVKVWFPSG